MRKPYIVGTLALGCLFLSSCTSIDHIQSQSRLETGVGNVFKARAAVYEDVRASAAEDVQGSPEPIDYISAGTTPTLLAARVALAEDAGLDLEKATALVDSGAAEDKISYLYRAAIKAWHAGSAGGRTAQAIYNAGSAACESLGEAKPPRDCAMLDAVIALTLAQSATDKIIEIHIKGLRITHTKLAESDAIKLIEAYLDLKDAVLLAPAENAGPLTQGLDKLEVAKKGAPLSKFIEGQMLVYRCYAHVARIVLNDVNTSEATYHLRKEAAELIRDNEIEDLQDTALFAAFGEKAASITKRLKGGANQFNNALEARGFAGFSNDDDAKCQDVAAAAQTANAQFLGLSTDLAGPG